MVSGAPAEVHRAQRVLHVLGAQVRRVREAGQAMKACNSVLVAVTITRHEPRCVNP